MVCGYFASTYIVLVAILLGTVSVASGGRFFENFFGLSLAGIDGIGQALHSPTLLIRTMFANTPALWALVPVAVLGLAINLARGEASIYDISFICHIPLLLLIFVDIGAGDNHLLDLAVLGVLVIGHASSSLSRALDEQSVLPRQLRTHRLTVVQTVVLLFALWITTTHLIVLVPDVYTAASALTAGGNANYRPLEGWITTHDTIMSEDPYVPVALGEVPVVMDAFMLLRIGKRHPDAVQALIGRIEAKEFNFVILTAPIERTEWWQNFISGATSFRRLIDPMISPEARKVITSIRPRTSRAMPRLVRRGELTLLGSRHAVHRHGVFADRGGAVGRTAARTLIASGALQLRVGITTEIVS